MQEDNKTFLLLFQPRRDFYISMRLEKRKITSQIFDNQIDK